MPDDSVTLLLDEVRGKTIRVLESVPAGDSRWAPPGLQNTILWHAGHCYFLLEWLTMRSLKRKPRIPNEWDTLFSWESHPELVDDDHWPALADVIEQLQDQHQRIRRIISKLTDDELSQPLSSDTGRSVRYAIVHALHDEACHGGEIYLLKKMRAVSRGRTG
jgi:DinB superfamily